MLLKADPLRASSKTKTIGFIIEWDSPYYSIQSNAKTDENSYWEQEIMLFESQAPATKMNTLSPNVIVLFLFIISRFSNTMVALCQYTQKGESYMSLSTD